MRMSTLAVSLSALCLIAACSHKERVVERPVVERQTVIEKPVIVPTPAAGGTAAGSCSCLTAEGGRKPCRSINQVVL